MHSGTNREKVSLEETLSFIKYLNREQPFDRQHIEVPTHDFEARTFKEVPIVMQQKTKKQKADEVSNEQLAKTINKNRAIKRIIESAFQILQNFKNYEEDQGLDSNDKSSQIQFNIYLKQFNRVLEMIYKLEKNKIKSEEERAERREEVLQNIYQYTVEEDFREILPVAILKDKISKNSIQMMIGSLQKSLVVLKPNELRIFSSTQFSSNYRSYKLHQIQNVDYHSQPHIFMVLAIQKDKERFNLYMKFQSEKNQEKWDRALYCCYIGRKMKVKERFFLIQYPEEDVKKKQKEEIKKQATFVYDIQPDHWPLENIFKETKTTQSDFSKEDKEAESEASPSNGGRGQQSLEKEEWEDGTPKERTKANESVAVLDNRSKRFTQNGSETNRLQISRERDKTELINRNKTDDNIERKKQSPPLSKANYLDLTDRQNSKTHIFGSRNNITQEGRQFHSNNHEETASLDLSPREQLPDEVKQIHDIERRNVKGLLLEKERFFFNKPKVAFLKEGTTVANQHEVPTKPPTLAQQYEAMKLRELEYWDFNSESGEKSERKVIKVSAMRSCSIVGQKNLRIVHDKQITFGGNAQQLGELHRWVELIKQFSALASPLIIEKEG